MRFRTRDSEEGQVPVLVIIIGAFAAVALLAVAWVGNSASGLAADTATCITTVAAGPTQSCVAGGGSGGSGTSHAQEADQTRISGPTWIDDFGSNKDAATIAALKIAKTNFNLGLQRFGGLKLTVANDTATYVTQLQNATTKAQALTALQGIRASTLAALADGEDNTVSNAQLQYAAALLTDVGHKAANVAWESQNRAEEGNQYVSAALTQASAGISSYNSLTLAQLKAYAPSISSNLSSASSTYATAMGKINATLGAL